MLSIYPRQVGGPSAVGETAYGTFKKLLSMGGGHVLPYVNLLKSQDRIYVYRQNEKFLLAVFGTDKQDHLMVPFETALDRPRVQNAVYIVRRKKEKYTL